MQLQTRMIIRWIPILAFVLTVANQGAERLPNVVIIFADDMAYADIGPFGAKSYSTPHLDALAKDGRKFTSFYVAQPVCSASRAALLTGCYPNRVGIQGALGPGSRIGISSNEVTIAELVKPKGYATAIYGKWHLGHRPEFLPTRHGFDEYYGLPYSNDMWPFHPEARKGTYPDLPLIEGEQTIETNPDQRKLTRAYTERAVRFIKRNKAKPFLLYVAHSMPHVPLFVGQRSRPLCRRDS
jgi:arylsulfatase A